MREKDQMLHFRVSKAELNAIREKMQELGTHNMAAYLRKMALDGYCIRLDLGDLKKVVSLMRYASNNLNQYAKKANETGSIYLEDIQDLKIRFEQIWSELKEIHIRLREKADTNAFEFDRIAKDLKAAEQRLVEIAALKKHIVNYAKTRDIQQYNRRLFQTRQEGIKGLESLEESCFQLSDYGISSEVFGVLAIPALDLEMPVYLGASSQNMALGAAQLGQTSIPVGGKNTNTVIAGHRGWNGADYFRYITELVPGDRITITNLWETLEYTVIGTRIISPDDVDAIKIQPDKDMITLFTCHPYASGGRQRYLVFCERIYNEIRKDDSK